MKTYFFLYNQTKIKSDLHKIYNATTDKFYLLASKFCLDNLSMENRLAFTAIHQIDKFDLDNIDAVLTGYITGSDTSQIKLITSEETCLLLCAELREKYQLSGTQQKTVLPFTDKLIMKDQLSKYNIRRPKYTAFNQEKYKLQRDNYLDELETALGYPMIVKPTRNAGSIDVTKIYKREDLLKCSESILHAEQTQEFEAEEYIDGALYHCDGIVMNNELLFFATCKYSVPCLDFAKGFALGSLLVQENDPAWSILFKFTQEALKALPPPDGAFHLEVFLTAKNEPIFLEIGARPPGVIAVPVYEKMLGVNLEEQHYRAQMGLPLQLKTQEITTYFFWMIFPQHSGVVRDFNKPLIKSQYEIEYRVCVGQSLDKAASILDFSAIILCWNESYQQLQQDFLALSKFEPIVLAEQGL